MLARGAAVVALDVAPAIKQLYDRKSYLGIECDLTNEEQISAALDQAVRTFGSVDMLVLNAGIFPKSSPIAAMPTDVWRRTMSINLDANVVLMRECHPLLKLAPRGGRVVIIGPRMSLPRAQAPLLTRRRSQPCNSWPESRRWSGAAMAFA